MDARTDENRIEDAVRAGDSGVRLPAGVTAPIPHRSEGRHRLSVNRCQAPLIGIIAQHPVCDAQWFDRCRKRQSSESLEREKKTIDRLTKNSGSWPDRSHL